MSKLTEIPLADTTKEPVRLMEKNDVVLEKKVNEFLQKRVYWVQTGDARRDLNEMFQHILHHH